MRIVGLYVFSLLMINFASATNRDSLALSSRVDADLNTSEENLEAEELYSDELIEFEANIIPVDENLFNFHVSSLEHVIPMEYNSYVKAQIDFFGTRWQYKLKDVITRSKYYFPIYEKIFDKNEVPLELKYLSVIESALNPYAVSRSGAVGPWQFMPATGRLFDLDQNYVVDERRSIEKSTQAAAEYLKSMYAMFGDWYVAIASYNCGPGNVRKAIRYSGRKDFWGMYRYLPRETQNYVPKFIAMAYMMNFYSEFGITASPPVDSQQVYHSVYCTNDMSFKVISDIIGVEEKTLLAYNPELKHAVIPTKGTGYWLNIPENKVSLFYQSEADIIAKTKEENLAAKEREAAEPKVLYHTVRKGECLPIIARKYGCSVSDLKKWNRIKGSLIYPNQKLAIYRS
ncbi:transglycosylase SLT domain-containing protein [bacterium]|nr:transglycosylase SLT domain-containing protein [bacterium]